MGKRATRITAQDIASAGGLQAFIKQLIRKISAGEAESKESAAAALRHLAEQNRSEHTEALYSSGAIGPLVKLLVHGTAAAQASAAGALQAIANKKEYQKAIVEGGAVEPLARLLKTGSAKAQEDAAAALAALDDDVSHQMAIIKVGCVPALVSMLKGGSVQAQAYASQALANAAKCSAEAGQNVIAGAGAVPLLLTLLEVGKAQKPAANALAQLARNNRIIQTEITEQGGIAPLLALLNGRNTDAQVQAAAALSELASGNFDTQVAISKAGGIGPLLALLASRSSSAQSNAMRALAQLAHENQDNQVEIARMGGIKPLVHLLDLNGAADVQSNAALALQTITRSNSPNQTAVVDNGGIGALAALMKNSQHVKVKAEVAGALWSLSEDDEIKVNIASAGTISPLVALLGGVASDETRALRYASKALASLGLSNTENQVQITQLLIELLANGSEAAQHRAVESLRTLIEENTDSHTVIATAGHPAALVDLLKQGIPDAKDHALWSLSLSISADNQGVVAETGGIQPLIDQIADPRVIIKEQAALALAKLALDNGDTRISITQSGGVKPLIQLLEPNDRSSELVRENAAAALADLAVDTTARDEIANTGGIRPLVLLLQDNGRNTKKFSAMALARLAKDHEAIQLSIAEAGAIVPLVALLDGNQGSDAQEEAAGAILALAEHEQNRLAITEADGISRLVSLLGCDNAKAREHAEGALVRLSIENANRVTIIRKLVTMLQDAGNAAQEQAAAALANLARESADNRKSIVDANGIPPLLALLDSASSKAKENSVGAITELCRNSKENQGMIAKVGGIPKLVGVLLGFSGTTMKEMSVIQLCTLAASAIKEMAKGNRKNQDAIAESGAIAPLVAMLGSPAAQMQANAAGALAHLARNHLGNQAAIAKTGAVAPLCTLIREGSTETKDESASALWSLATDNAPNKDTIAKLGGIDPLVGLLVSGTSERSQECVAGALAALASKHSDNRQLIAKRLVGLLGSSAARAADRAVRVLMTCSSFCSDSPANQVAIAKGGGIPPLIVWLQTNSQQAQVHATQAIVCLATDNNTTQILIAKSNAIPPLIQLVKRSSPAAQENAARALWHLASQAENQAIISDAGGIKPLVGMLSADGPQSAELSAIIMVRLARANPEVSVMIADKGGINPLVKLTKQGTPGAQQQAAAAIAELALVSRNRDAISNADGIEPLIKLMDEPIPGTPETAARAISHLAREDEKPKKEEGHLARRRGLPVAEERAPSSDDPAMIRGEAQRRAKINSLGGVKKLITMLDGKEKRRTAKSPVSPSKHGNNSDNLPPLPPSQNSRIGVQEQASAALADMAHSNADMQDAIIEANGIPPLLAFIRTGSQVGQEHAARAIWHLSEQIDNQPTIVDCGTIPDLVQLLRTGSSKAQEVAAAGISDLARGAIVEMEKKEAESAASQKASKQLDPSISNLTPASEPTTLAPAVAAAPSEAMKEGKPSQDGEEGEHNRLIAIADAGGVTPLVALLSSSNTQARENAAGALWHLARDPSNQVAIARSNGISPLVTILDDGTPQAHEHAANAIARLAIKNAENQTQIAKHLVGLLSNPSAGAQRRSAHALRDLAGNNPGSPVLIVNAGAISPLVNLLSNGKAEVKEEAAGALSTLALNSPANQLAIATGLVALVGNGSAEAQEHVSQLLLTLAHDPDNRIAISKSGAIQRLVVQMRGGGYTSNKAQELAAAVLSHLSPDSRENVSAIASAGGIRPLVALLTSDSPMAQARSAAVLSDMARFSKRNQNTIVNEGGIAPLVNLLAKENNPNTKAQGAGALQSLALGQPELQKSIADAFAIKPLVALLSEQNDLARKKGAGAIAALSSGSTEIQDAVEKCNGIAKLVGLLEPSIGDAVRAEAASALAVLARGHSKNQDKVAASGGIKPIIALLQAEELTAKEEAAAALWSLAAKHHANQNAVAESGGIAPLVAVLGSTSVRAQEQSAGALAALALDNKNNEISIAKLVVSLLHSDSKQASAKAARAISRLARSHTSNQAAIATAGGIALLVELLDPEEGGVGGAHAELSPAESLERAQVQMEIASAVWSMTFNHSDNQAAIAKAGGLVPLIALLDGHPEVHRDAAGALWSLAGDSDNQIAIATLGGITPLVNLLKTGRAGAQETAAGALQKLAETATNRVAIAKEGGISPLVALLDGGSEECKEQAAFALQNLVTNNFPNQLAVSHGLVDMLKSGSSSAQEHVTQLFRKLALDPENRGSIAKAGAVPELVRQLECGSEKAMGMAASALALIALKSAEHRATVTQELVKLLGSENEAVRQRASEALRDMAKEDNPNSKKNVTTGGGGPLVNLLKDGLKDGRVEAQEYALWSLSSITDTANKEAIVQAGGIKPLIASLMSGKLSAIAQEHAAAVLSGLAPIGNNAETIKAANGIEPLVQLLSEGNVEAKEHSAAALASLALRADAALEIAKAGAVSAFVTWLADPTLGPPEVAARALSEIALDNPDTQSQIVEENAISPLVAMVCAAGTSGQGDPKRSSTVATALKQSDAAAGAIATLAKDHLVNQMTVTEEDGVQPLVALLQMKHLPHENATKALWHLAATEDNQTAIAKSGGIAPLVGLLSSEHETTQQYAAAALESLSRDHMENQIALSRAGAIAPLVSLLGCDSVSTQEHAVGALLYLASHDEESRNAVVGRLVAVLDMRSAAAQMKAAEALAVLASRNAENRKAITAADAVSPLVRLLGDGRRARSETPQERAAAVLADLAKLGENRTTIVDAGGVPPLVEMLKSGAPDAQMHAAGALGQLAALGPNKAVIAEAGGIAPLVDLLAKGSPDAQKFSAVALWHLASSADNRTTMVNAGAIPAVVALLESKTSDGREYAAAVLSALARTQGGNKKAVYRAGGIRPLVKLLNDSNPLTQKHAACSLWGMSDGKDGVYDAQIVEYGAVPSLIKLLQNNHEETRGFAAACLSCLCKDENSRQGIIEAGGVDALMLLAGGPQTWLRSQVHEMLKLLSGTVPDPETIEPPKPPILAGGDGGKGPPATQSAPSSHRQRTASQNVISRHYLHQRDSGQTKMKFHFFSFQISKANGFREQRLFDKEYDAPTLTHRDTHRSESAGPSDRSSSSIM